MLRTRRCVSLKTGIKMFSYYTQRSADQMIQMLQTVSTPKNIQNSK